MHLRHVIAGLARLAKPMAFDSNAVKAYCDTLARKILSEAAGIDKVQQSLGFGNRMIVEDSYDITDVRGHKHTTDVYVSASTDVSGFTFVHDGHYGRVRSTGGKAVVVNVSGLYPIDKLKQHEVAAGLYRVLSHEFVHAQEAFDTRTHGMDVKEYYNSKTEVNAYLRNVLDELEPKARDFAAILRRTPGEAGVREFASKSGSWNQVSKHLSDKNQVKFLSEVWQRFHKEPKSAPASELVAALRSRFGVKAYASLRSQDGQLDLSMLSDPKKDADNATAALALVCKFADRHGLMVLASPGSEFAGSKERAVKAYLGMGFVRNRGRTKDFTISDTMYRLPRGQKTAALTSSGAEQRFRELAAEIWGANIYETYLRDRIKMSTETPTGDVLASVTSNGTQAARAQTLRRFAPSYTLRLSPRFYELPDDRAEGILKHEVLHLGYPRHDAAFNEHARSIGAPLTEMESEGGKVEVQVKDGARFRTVQEFDTEDEARAFARSVLRDRDHELFGKKLRMRM